MIHQYKSAIAALAASAIFSATGAWAANLSNSGQSKPAQESRADKDFGKLSFDGAQAFQDVSLARLAIYEGDTEKAKKLASQADKGFAKARTDESVFTKAEVDLKPPASMKTPANEPSQTSNEGRSGSGGQNYASADKMSKDQMTAPVAWLPVDGAITINEDFTGNNQKTAAVADANKSLKSGDRKAAMEKLKLAGVDVDMSLGVVPLQYTINKVHQAAELITDGKYYEGSQLLRQVQNAEHFDIIDQSGTPEGGSMKSSGDTGANSMPMTDQNKSATAK